MQLNLNFSKNSNNNLFFSSIKEIISLENKASINLLEKFFAQKEFSENSIKNLILIAENDFEKEVLLKFFLSKKELNFINFAEIESSFFAQKIAENNFYILEKIDEKIDQEKLLHLINYCANGNIFLLLTATKKITFKLKDLNSRIKNIATAKIEKVKNNELILSSILAEKQIRLSKKLIIFFAKNLAKNYQILFNFADFIEEKISEKKPNQVNLLQEFISSVNSGDAES